MIESANASQGAVPTSALPFALLSERRLKKIQQGISYITISGLETAFEQCMGDAAQVYCFSPRVELCNKVLEKLLHRRVADAALVKQVRRQNKKVFYAGMGLAVVRKNAPTLAKISDQLVLYVFDCWQPEWPQWKALFDEIQPSTIFFAYQKASDYFQQFYGNCHMLPQSMNLAYFHDYNQPKTRPFMQMGRRTELLHECVLRYLAAHQMPEDDAHYVYERAQGCVIFPDTAQLAAEVSATSFFISAPQDYANHARTGDISEVTARFYEAMACKTLVVGIKPKDTFDLLFPYPDAMVEVNAENFDAQIDALRADPARYQAMVEKNYAYVMQHHRWHNRYAQVAQVLAQAEEARLATQGAGAENAN